MFTAFLLTKKLFSIIRFLLWADKTNLKFFSLVISSVLKSTAFAQAFHQKGLFARYSFAVSGDTNSEKEA